ncbi:MAG: hypothetical protein U0X73_07970 [Thermoanaerobaculia bacterium]
MRNILGTLVAIAGLLPSRPAAAKDDLVGVWELVSISPVEAMDSDPRGVPNRKEVYSTNGMFFILDPWEKKLDPERSLPYEVVGNRRVITLPDGEKETTEFQLTGETLLLKHSPTETWSYRRLGGEEAVAQELEPRSLLILAEARSSEQAKIGEVTYDHSDYSALPTRDRIQGLWEVNTVSGIPAADRPPFGFQNLKLLFRETRLCVLAPNEVEIDEKACRDCKLEGATLSCGAEEMGRSRFMVDFNRWGHLELHEGPATTTLRLVSRNTSTVPRLPVKVVLYVE